MHHCIAPLDPVKRGAEPRRRVQHHRQHDQWATPPPLSFRTSRTEHGSPPATRCPLIACAHPSHPITAQLHTTGPSRKWAVRAGSVAARARPSPRQLMHACMSHPSSATITPRVLTSLPHPTTHTAQSDAHSEDADPRPLPRLGVERLGPRWVPRACEFWCHALCPEAHWSPCPVAGHSGSRRHLGTYKS